MGVGNAVERWECINSLPMKCLNDDRGRDVSFDTEEEQTMLAGIWHHDHGGVQT